MKKLTYSIQESRDNDDWHYKRDLPKMKFNDVSKDVAMASMKWLKENSITGNFHRVVETIFPAEIRKFVDWFLDDDDCLEIAQEVESDELVDAINNEARDYFGQSMSFELFVEIKNEIANRV